MMRDMTAGEVVVEGPEVHRGWRRVLRRRDGRTPVWFELAVMAWLFWLYDVINNLAPTRRPLAIRDARGLLHFERSLGIDIEYAADHWLGAHSVLSFIATYYYFFAHVLVTVAVLALLWWLRPGVYPWMRTQLVLVNLIAFVVFWRYPVAPPRMLPGMGYEDVVASTHAVISWDSATLVHEADQFAAMPSLHIAWAVWSALGIWQLAGRRRAVRGLGVLHVLLTSIVVIATGNHWLLDVLAGCVTALGGVALLRVAAYALAVRRRRVAAELGEARPQRIGARSGVALLRWPRGPESEA